MPWDRIARDGKASVVGRFGLGLAMALLVGSPSIASDDRSEGRTIRARPLSGWIAGIFEPDRSGRGWPGRAPAQAKPGPEAFAPRWEPTGGTPAEVESAPMSGERTGRFPGDPAVRLAQVFDGLPDLPEPRPEAPPPDADQDEEKAVGPDLLEGGVTEFSAEAAELGADVAGVLDQGISGFGDTFDEITQPRAEVFEDAVGRPFLQEALGLEGRLLSFRGWIQNSFSGNPANPPDGVNFGEYPNGQANQWQGNQYYLIFERLPRREGRPELGFRVDNLFGNDWSFTKSYGLADEAFDPGQFSGFDLPQFFAELHLPILTEGGLDIRGGRWYSPAGYEAVEAIERPLFSVSNLMNFTPFTFFGMLATQHLDERTDLYLGTVNGWDRFLNSNYRWNTLVGLTRNSADERTQFSAFAVVGPNQLPSFPSARSTFLPTGVRTSAEVAGLRNFGYAKSPRFYASFVLVHDWTDRLTQAMEVAWVQDRNTPLMRGPGSPSTGARGTRQNTEWYGFANWFLYEFDPKLAAVWRSEAFRDDDGVLLGSPNTYYEMTLGLIAKPRPWFWVRPEIRFDWSRTGTPYDAGRAGSQMTISVDAIILY